MPNWCMNNLTITCSKEHKKELQSFKEAASNMEVVKKEDLENERKLWLKERGEKYRKDGRLADWVEHNTMPIKDFCVKVLGWQKMKNDDMQKGSSHLSMQKLLPCPEELNVTSPPRAEKGESEKEFQARQKRNMEQYGATNWYDWNCKMWGTKWDVTADIHNETETELGYAFDSAWSPPVLFIMAMSNKYPNLKFSLEYDEPGMCFRGTFTADNGEFDDNHEDGYTPTCNECEEEYDDDGLCSCERDEE